MTAQNMIYKLSFSITFVNNNPHIAIGDSFFFLWMVSGQVEPLCSGVSWATTSPFVLYSEIIKEFIFNNNSVLPSREITIIIASHISIIQMAKLRIIWKKSVTVKNTFILHMAQNGSTYPRSGISWAILLIFLGHLKWNYLEWGDEQCTGTKTNIHI